jgi:hypothetical protein
VDIVIAMGGDVPFVPGLEQAMRSLTVPVLTVVLVSAVGFAQSFPEVSEPFVTRLALREYVAAGRPCPPTPAKLEIPKDLPADAKTAVANFQTEADVIRKKAEEDIRAKADQLAVSLKTIQDQYTRDAKLDEAVAVRDLIRRLQASSLPMHPYPGSLMPFREHVGETFYFEVTGQTGRSIWGTEVYTLDSDLGTAAVHIGAKKAKPGSCRSRSSNRPNSTHPRHRTASAPAVGAAIPPVTPSKNGPDHAKRSSSDGADQKPRVS